MFNFGAFIKKGLLDAVGKLADYQVILNAAGWMEKGVLNEADLIQINAAIEAKNQPSAPAQTQDTATDMEETEVTENV